VIEGKRILADAFAADLPQAVLGRRAKVSWDGVCARTYARNADAILQELDTGVRLLEHVGFDVNWLIRRVGALARWERTNFGQDDREVFAAYAVATWFRSWDITRLHDVAWRS
jgi:hypothetical protein